jgi:hypothetical protein
MNRITISRQTQLLIGANLMLALIVSAEMLLPARSGTADAAVTDDGNVALPEFGDTTIVAPPISQLVDMMERPLFYIARRMPEAEVEKVAAPPPRPLKLKLEGIAISGGSRVAVLRNLNGNGLVQLGEGDTHDGWTLDSLTSTSASFIRGEQTNELLLDPATTDRRR